MCSYCLRPRSETGPLLMSPLAAICRDCAENARERFAERDREIARDPAASDTEDDVEVSAPWKRLDDDTLLARIGDVNGAGDQVEEHLKAWVGAARERGISWARIGAALGITRQSAWERFAA